MAKNDLIEYLQTQNLEELQDFKKNLTEVIKSKQHLVGSSYLWNITHEIDDKPALIREYIIFRIREGQPFRHIKQYIEHLILEEMKVDKDWAARDKESVLPRQ